MGNRTKRLAVIGTVICLSAAMLQGCGTAEKENTESKSSSQAKEKETVKEEKPETQTAENPQFVSDGIRKLVLVKDGQEIFNLSKEPADYKMDFDYWEILNPYDEIVTVNTETMYTMFDALTGLAMTAPVAVPEGVDTGISASTTTMTIDFVNTLDTDTAKQTKYADSTSTLVIGSEDGEGNRYAAVKGFETSVYKISSSLLDSVYALNPFDYILKIPALVNIETVKSVDIKAGDNTYTMEADKDTYKLGKKKVEKEAFTTLYQALMNVMLKSEIEAGKEPAGEKEEKLSVTFTRNREDAPNVTLVYYAYDKDFDSVEINGTERFLVNAADVDALLEQIKKAY